MSDAVAFIIRPALPTDAAALSGLALRSKAYWGYSESFLEACREELEVTAGHIASPQSDYRVAERDGALLGYYALDMPGLSGCELEALFLEPAVIGQGIGQRLFLHAMAVARDAGCGSLVIQSDPNALEFYLAMGATVIGETPSGSVPGRMLPLLQYDLASAPGAG